MVEVNAVLHRLESGRLRPTQAYELSHALVSALTGRLRDFTATLTRDVWKLEQRVTAGISVTRSNSWTRCSGPGTAC
jgi:magnesium transporter